jgi:hypothetical protein
VTHHGRDRIREDRPDLHSPTEFFTLKHPLGAPRKVNGAVISEVGQLTRGNLRLPSMDLAHILSASDNLPSVNHSFVAFMWRRNQKGCDKEGVRIGQ